MTKKNTRVLNVCQTLCTTTFLVNNRVTQQLPEGAGAETRRATVLSMDPTQHLMMREKVVLRP